MRERSDRKSTLTLPSGELNALGPTSVSRTLGCFRAFCWRQLRRTRLSALEAALAPERDRSRVLYEIWLRFYDLANSQIDYELSKLVGVSGSFA